MEQTSYMLHLMHLEYWPTMWNGNDPLTMRSAHFYASGSIVFKTPLVLDPILCSSVIRTLKDDLFSDIRQRCRSNMVQGSGLEKYAIDNFILELQKHLRATSISILHCFRQPSLSP